MLLQLAADIVVPRPTGPGGWLLIALGLVFTASIIARGMVSFSKSVRDRLMKPLYFLIALGFAYLVSQIVSTDPEEPLARTEVEVFPNEGTVQLNGPDGSVDHSHDGN